MGVLANTYNYVVTWVQNNLVQVNGAKIPSTANVAAVFPSNTNINVVG